MALASPRFPLLSAVLVGSLIGTWLLRRYALRRNVLDIPNARSSHSVPTPRGGGVAIVVAFLAGTIAACELHRISSSTAWSLFGGGSIVAVVGFIDDHRHIPARWRLLAHFAAAGWALARLGGLPPLIVAGYAHDLGIFGDAMAAIALVWLLNLYNFMDGIDGIAGVEAVTVCIGAIVLALVSPAATLNWSGPALLAAGTLGFLIWNFPPAKIFMGDAGSGFLGLTLGVFAIDASRVSPEYLWCWLILLGAFIVDATVTLVFRWRHGERLHEAHRSHAYQHAAQRYGSHRPVTLAVGAMNLLWLLPIALLVGTRRLDGLLATVIAYMPLVWLAINFRAGRVSTPRVTAS
jgi:Fuc2NAc and GlcNAc transferase